MRHSIAMGVAFLLVGLVVSACDPGFDEKRKVEDMRILAAATQPPEAVVEASLLQLYAALESFEAQYEIPGDFNTEIRVLIENPEAPDGPITYTIEACIIDSTFKCNPDYDIVPIESGETTPGELVVPVTIPRSLAEQALEGDDLNGLFGGVVWVHGVVSDGTFSDEFVKAFTILPDYDYERSANANPEFDAFLQGELDEEVPLETNADGRIELAPGEKIRLLPTFTEGSRETYVLVSFNPEDFGEAVEEEEALTVFFYSSCGEFKSASKTEEVFFFFETDEDKEEQNLSSEWTAPEIPELCSLWFVADDGRGGVAWAELEVDVK